MTDARHIFRIDGTDCFLAEPPQGAPVPADEMLADCPLPEEFVWCSVQEVRAVRPMAAAFAAITALQLHRWYKSRASAAAAARRRSRAARSAPWSAPSVA